MGSYIKVVDFLPENTELLIMVNPSPDLDPNLKEQLTQYRKRYDYVSNNKYPVPLFLKEPLKIKFYISNSNPKKWTIHKELKQCKCTTQTLPDQELRSVNEAYQKISKHFETGRMSNVGTVYRQAFFQSESKKWLPLEKRRKQIYEPYQEEYERIISVHNDRTPAYLPSLPSSGMDLLDDFIKGKDELIKILQSENQEQIDQLKKLKDFVKKSKLNVYRDKLTELKKRLEEDHPETRGDNSWQRWIYKNTWLFAAQYNVPLPQNQVGNSIPDFLFPTLDGFIDILEIKLPTFEVVRKDASHPGSYKWSKEANEAIGQVVNYLSEIEQHQANIVKRIEENQEIRLSAIKSRGIILIGQSGEWKRPQHEALRKLNHSLHSIEIITYTDLLNRGESLIKMYDNQP